MGGSGKTVRAQGKAGERRWEVKGRQREVKERQWKAKGRQGKVKERQWEAKERQCEVNERQIKVKKRQREANERQGSHRAAADPESSTVSESSASTIEASTAVCETKQRVAQARMDQRDAMAYGYSTRFGQEPGWRSPARSSPWRESCGR